MSLPDGSLSCYKERGCYPVWGFSGGTPGSSGRVSSSARSQNAPLGRSQSSIDNLQSAIPTWTCPDVIQSGCATRGDADGDGWERHRLEFLGGVVDIDAQEVTVGRVGVWVPKAPALSPVVPGAQGGWW